VDRDGAFISRRGPGEGVGCRNREPEKGQEQFQMANRKWQNSNGLSPIGLWTFQFAICRLPFAI